MLIALLIVANLLNIAADTSAVGEGMKLLHAGPAELWAAIAGVAVTGLIVVGSFERITIAFKVLSLALLTYVVVLFAANPKWTDVLTHTLVPHVEFSKDYMLLLVAVLGTTISPYLFFWQSANRIEELRADDEGGSKANRSTSDADRNSSSAPADWTTSPAWPSRTSSCSRSSSRPARRSAPRATRRSPARPRPRKPSNPRPVGWPRPCSRSGSSAPGMLAIPVLAGSGASALASLLHKPWGFSRSFRNAPFFYVLVGLGTLGGTLFTLLGVDPVKLLVFSALINGLLAPPFLVLVMLISNDRKIMGEHCNGRAAHAARLDRDRPHDRRRPPLPRPQLPMTVLIADKEIPGCGA